MSTHLRRALAGLAGLALLLTAACSLSEGEQSSADSMSRAMVTDATPKVEKENIDCVAEKFVGQVGVDRLTKAGLLNKKGEAVVPRVRRSLRGTTKVAPAINTAYADAWLACTDFDEVGAAEKKNHPKATEEDLDELSDCLKEVDRSTWEAAGMNNVRARARALNQCTREVGIAS